VAQYDLLTEPWLQCAMLDGTVQPKGLCEILAQAHEIKEVAEPSPLVTFGAYRLLLAIVHWLRPMKTVNEWRQAWQAGRFDQAFLAELAERGKGCFDLFADTNRFYQHAEGGASKTRKGVAYLAYEFPTETYITHFCHVHDDQHASCPACCAGGLIALSAFATQGGAGHYASINGTPPLYVLPCGPTLFHTLLVNLPIGELADVWPEGHSTDVPAWLRSRGDYRGEGPVGLLEGLTWQPRRAYLYPDDTEGTCTCCGRTSTILVRQMGYAPHGDTRGSAEERRAWADPHVPLRAKDDRPVTPGDEPSTWAKRVRSMLCAPRSGETVPPPALRQLARLAACGAIPADTHLRTAHFAAVAKKATVASWSRQEWHTPAQFLTNQDLASAIAEQLDHAEDLADQVTQAVTRGLTNRNARRAARKEALQALDSFHAKAEQAFREALADMATKGAAPDDALATVAQRLHEAALATYDRLRLKRPMAERWQRGRQRAFFDRAATQLLSKGGTP